MTVPNVDTRRHTLVCRYAGLEFTSQSRTAPDCCCFPLDAPIERCGFVTGHTRGVMDWKARRGRQRSDGRYEVLCGYPATYMVHGSDVFGPKLVPTCGRDLAYTVDSFDRPVTVVKL